MSQSAFLDRIREGVLIGDGAVGTELFARGATPDRGVERLNLTAPGLVEVLHRDYIAAGSAVIETNTFGANPLLLARYGAEEETRDILLAGAAIARKAAGDSVFVAGSVGPLPLIDGEPIDPGMRDDIIRLVVTTLVEGGVDLVLFETFTDIGQIIAGIRVARKITEIPVVAQMAFERGGRIAAGGDVEKFVSGCIEAGADIVGANCGAGAAAVRDAAERIGTYGVPVSAYMNAGFAEEIEGRQVYMATTDYLARTAADLVGKGVRLIGGCCGTSPATIRAIKATVEAQTGVAPSVTGKRKPSVTVPELPAEQARPQLPGRILVELDPPKTPELSHLLEATFELRDAGVSAVTLADNPLASVRVDILAASAVISREAGIPLIPHLTGRDRNRIALQSTIMGAHALGVRSLLCVTGDPVRMYNETNTTGVFDVTSIGLVGLVQEFNEGRRLPDGHCTAFSIGVALNPNVRNIGGQVTKLQRKIDAGADFALTQPVFDPKRFDMLAEALYRASITIPVYLGVMPLVSARNAEFLHNEVPGIVIPDEYRSRIARHDTVADQRTEGIAIATELVEAVAGRVHGFYFITPRNKASFVTHLVAAALAKMKPAT